jgi:coenzyme F420-0:L-glutamate ligase/coenzyme F420-1:gamma-L-glutamate ligase
MTPPAERARVEVIALAGIGEVRAGDDLAALVLAAVQRDPDGPLRDGDILVVTSKVLSKSEGRAVPADERDHWVRAGAVHTLARRGPARIVRTRSGLTLAAAGVDNSNVDPGSVLLLPADPDASAAGLHAALQQRTGRRLGVVVSDTLGRAWRMGQTDTAIGAAGVRVLEAYAGRRDRYGNDLQVTAVALADELAAAADLVKTKLAGRPVALVRGLAHLVTDDPDGAATLVREPATDMFGYGSREAVLAAVLAVTGQPGRYEEVLDAEPADRADAVLAGAPGLDPAVATFVRTLLDADLVAPTRDEGSDSKPG